ncbi:uncharacterized protein A4U43_C02F12970 [Asparagus officinalis]|uniref:Uncharacterized protein n=1 Tax=Asparagus officinalis TaxID=4686 RepID=A0A5P1FMR7_ASPOF|nr:uncharacterized protein A4U43_C02F12970 [Asparagus officinalis]
MIDSLKALDSQKSTEIDKLKHELFEWNKRIKFLSEECCEGGERDGANDEAIEDSTEEASKDLSKDSYAGSSGKKVGEGDESKV